MSRSFIPHFEAPKPSGDRPRPPVTVISGFLGAGKTTWLSCILQQPHGLRVALMVNDVGEVNIDAALLSETQTSPHVVNASETVALTNGCICCSVRDTLAETIAELASSGDYDHLVVECSGVAEPRSVADLFIKPNAFGRRLADFAELHAMITLVDASQFLAEHRGQSGVPRSPRADATRPVFELMVEQVECADVLIINKCDLVKPPEMDELSNVLGGLNPRAEQFPSLNGQTADPVWPGEPRFDPRETLTSAAWHRSLDEAFDLARQGGPRCDRVSPSKSMDFAARFGIQHFLVTRRKPISEERLRDAVENHIPGLLRAKGFFWGEEEPDRIGYLSVAGRNVKTAYLRPWAAAMLERGIVTWEAIPDSLRELWAEPHGDRRQELVFIGLNLDPAAIEDALFGTAEVTPA